MDQSAMRCVLLALIASVATVLCEETTLTIAAPTADDLLNLPKAIKSSKSDLDLYHAIVSDRFTGITKKLANEAYSRVNAMEFRVSEDTKKVLCDGYDGLQCHNEAVSKLRNFNGTLIRNMTRKCHPLQNEKFNFADTRFGVTKDLLNAMITDVIEPYLKCVVDGKLGSDEDCKDLREAYKGFLAVQENTKAAKKYLKAKTEAIEADIDFCSKAYLDTLDEKLLAVRRDILSCLSKVNKQLRINIPTHNTHEFYTKLSDYCGWEY